MNKDFLLPLEGTEWWARCPIASPGVGGPVRLGKLARFCALAAGLAAPLHAQTPRDSVIAVVREFFRAMTARGTAATARVQLAGGWSFAVGEDGDTVALRQRSNAKWLRRLAASRDTLTKHIWDATVLVHGHGGDGICRSDLGEYGLQQMNGEAIRVPGREALRPRREYLEERFERFRVA